MRFFHVIGLIMSIGSVAFGGNQLASYSQQPGFFGPIAFVNRKEVSPSGPYLSFRVSDVVDSRVPVEGVAGYSRNGRPVKAFYFPGTSSKRALIIGGVHGSELSAIEVTKKLIENLGRGERTYYSVIIIPCLFPDNASHAASRPGEIGSVSNVGRYSYEASADPNRQMPALGKAFDISRPFDFAGRPIEPENQLLLQVIQEFRPQRIVNVHGIRSVERAGIYADPRTDSKGYALGYNSDSILAIAMATYIESNGGNAPGNLVNDKAIALYYADPPIAKPGQRQGRNLHGSRLPGNRGYGVSLGSWASTAVNDALNSNLNRPAIRLLTMEFPGNKRPTDYEEPVNRFMCERNVELYAGSIERVFLSSLSEE